MAHSFDLREDEEGAPRGPCRQAIPGRMAVLVAAPMVARQERLASAKAPPSVASLTRP